MPHVVPSWAALALPSLVVKHAQASVMQIPEALVKIQILIQHPCSLPPFPLSPHLPGSELLMSSLVDAPGPHIILSEARLYSSNSTRELCGFTP